MPRIRRATATATADDSAANVVAVALNNNDGEDRRIYGALLTVIAGNDTLSSQQGIQALWSTQAFSTEFVQQGLELRGMGVDRRAADEARAGPFLVVQTSGRDDKEDANEVYADFGHPDNFLPWPDGAQMHLGIFAEASNHNGGRAHGILYYQEGAGGL